MYNDTIKVANKIISDTDLLEIFQRMNDGILENIQICKQETIQNEKYEREYQNWTTKNFSGSFKVTINFYDDTNITIDNYQNFLSLYNTRLDEMKSFWVRCSYSYTIQHGKETNMINKHIYMNISENKMDIEVNLSSVDNKMDDIYQLIKEKILAAPERYDRVIQKQNSIRNKVTFALGTIPSIIICVLFLFVSIIRQIFALSYVGFPIATLVLGFIIGNTFFSSKLDKLYSSIVPEKKYAGYDRNKQSSIYTDDVDKYVNTSEIIIGKNINNIQYRKEIIDLEEKYTKYIPVELIIIFILSIIVIFLG